MNIHSTTMSQIINSWACKSRGQHTLEELLDWVKHCNESTSVQVDKSKMHKNGSWYYDESTGAIKNQDDSFFSIRGCRWDGKEQPIIVQNEIGYLGILCKPFDNVMHFLMQSKIEPGNINKTQISPTLQATKSNFTQRHGGKKPHYIKYFLSSDKYEVVVDQLQSEQSSRFYKKRNRNIILKIEDNITVRSQYRWMTLGQIKALMKYDNLINMDTRTVLSCIPFSMISFTPQELCDIKDRFQDHALYRSIFIDDGAFSLPEIYQYINTQKMFNNHSFEFVPLNKMKDWQLNEYGVFEKQQQPFQVIYCDISIEGREVKQWSQPLLQANHSDTYVLMYKKRNGVAYFLVQAIIEIGCFDCVELGPSLMLSQSTNIFNDYLIYQLFQSKWSKQRGIQYNALLSEEGGRFFHEQNRNVIIEIEEYELQTLPKGYFWMNYRTINLLSQFNNCLNIQLRNLFSMLEV